jgi:predicted DsbA family dithiol-disulfide isomerase
MHDRLFGDQKALDEKGLEASAQALGLDAGKFKQCLDTGKFKAEIQSEIAEGQKLGVTGTPSFFLGLSGKDPDKFRATQKIGGALPYTAFKKAIDDIMSPPKEKSAAKPGEAPAQKPAEQAKPGS